MKRKTIEPSIPVYKEQLGKLTDDYLHDNGYWPGQSPRRSGHAKELAEWQEEYDALIVINEPKVIGARTSYEQQLLSLINAFTTRYGFEHPKTQELVTKHQKFMARWNREEWDRHVFESMDFRRNVASNGSNGFLGQLCPTCARYASDPLCNHK
jgi:hypothetical protein